MLLLDIQITIQRVSPFTRKVAEELEVHQIQLPVNDLLRARELAQHFIAKLAALFYERKERGNGEGDGSGNTASFNFGRPGVSSDGRGETADAEAQGQPSPGSEGDAAVGSGLSVGAQETDRSASGNGETKES